MMNMWYRYRMLRTLACALVTLALGSVIPALAAERADGDAILIHNGWIGTTKQLIWRNEQLKDLADFTCLMWGGSVSDNVKWGTGTNNKISQPRGEATGFVMSESATSKVVQFRFFKGGTIWAVKVTFTQEGDDVYAQANWARYNNNNNVDINVNLETSYSGGKNQPSVATSSSATGYGAYQVTARCTTRPLPPGPIVCPAAHGFIPYSAPALLWKNAKLSDLSGLNAWIGGPGTRPRVAEAFAGDPNGTRQAVQFRSRLPSGTIYCVRVDFIQNGNCIYGQAGYAKYALNTASIDYDFDANGTFAAGVPAYGWNNGSGTYGAYAISATFNGEHSPFFTGVCGAWVPDYSPDVASGDRLVWRNVPLARVRNVRGVAGGKSSNFTPACEQHRVFTPGNGVDTPDTLATQLSWVDENSNVRCAKVLFTQQGEDVVAHVEYVKYVEKKTVDFDFDNGGTTYDHVAKGADDATNGSCGISRLQADIIPEDDGPTQVTDEDGNVSILASAPGAAVTDLALAGTLSVNGAGPFALDGENEIGVLAVEGIAAAQHPASDYWFLPSRICHVNEFVVSGTGVNTIGQLAWRDITQLEKVDATFGKPQIGLTLSGSNTVARPFVPPSFTFFRIKSGYTSLPFLAPVTGELGNGALFAVDEGATLALGGYDHQGNKPINFAVAGSLVVADTLALDGSSTLSGTGTVTAKAIASAGSAKFDGVTLLAPAAGCTLSGSSTVTAAGLTVGEGRTELANGAKLLGGTVSVTGTLAVPQTATVDSLAAPDGTVEVGKDTMITVSSAVATAGIGTLKVVSDDAKYADWRGEPRPFMKGPGLTRDCVKQVIDPASSMRIWRVSVTDGETAGEKVLSLQCRLPFSLIFR